MIVQTLAPNASSIEHAARHDSAGFLAGELERRELLRYPPYSHLVRIGFTAEQEARLEDGRRGARRASCAQALPRAARTCSARRRCSASATATAAAS